MLTMPAARATDTAAPFVPWPAFREALAEDWRQGEHVSLIGPTGTGKSTLGLDVLDLRGFTAVLATKPDDDTTLTGYMRRHRLRREDHLPPDARRQPRSVVWPRYKGMSDRPRQRALIARAIDEAFRRGRFALFVDEASYVCRSLRLAPLLTDVWDQGRSGGTSLVAATQRPAFVPLQVYSAATHLFFWRTNDERDLRRISGLNGMSSRTVADLVANLDTASHEALYVNTRTGTLARTALQKGPR